MSRVPFRPSGRANDTGPTAAPAVNSGPRSKERPDDWSTKVQLDTQAVPPLATCDPGGHVRHDVAPLNGAYEPSLHGAHSSGVAAYYRN